MYLTAMALNDSLSFLRSSSARAAAGKEIKPHSTPRLRRRQRRAGRGDSNCLRGGLTGSGFMTASGPGRVRGEKRAAFCRTGKSSISELSKTRARAGRIRGDIRAWRCGRAGGLVVFLALSRFPFW